MTKGRSFPLPYGVVLLIVLKLMESDAKALMWRRWRMALCFVLNRMAWSGLLLAACFWPCCVTWGYLISIVSSFIGDWWCERELLKTLRIEHELWKMIHAFKGHPDFKRHVRTPTQPK